MSVTVDANVLVHASNEAEPVHRPARQLLERLVAGPEIVYLHPTGEIGRLFDTGVGKKIHHCRMIC